MTDKNEIGRHGEDLAAKFLSELGYDIVDRNYQYLMGEIDIIAMDGDILVIAEVKTRSYDDHGSPVLSVDSRKQRLLQRTAERFIVQRKLRRPRVRFDIVSIVMGAGKPAIELHKNAF